MMHGSGRRVRGLHRAPGRPRDPLDLYSFATEQKARWAALPGNETSSLQRARPIQDKAAQRSQRPLPADSVPDLPDHPALAEPGCDQAGSRRFADEPMEDRSWRQRPERHRPVDVLLLRGDRDFPLCLSSSMSGCPARSRVDGALRRSRPFDAETCVSRSSSADSPGIPKMTWAQTFSPLACARRRRRRSPADPCPRPSASSSVRRETTGARAPAIPRTGPDRRRADPARGRAAIRPRPGHIRATIVP